MKKSFWIPFIVIIVLLSSCSPSSVVSGTYTGSFDGYMIPVTSGTATVIVTSVDDTHVSVTITSSGNPEYTVPNIILTRYNVLGIVYYDLSYSVYPWYLYGNMWEQNRQLEFTLDSDTSSMQISFDGTK